jgi:hypothetical protein
LNKKLIEEFYKLFDFNAHSNDTTNPFKNFAGWLTSMNPYEFATISTVLGLLISTGLTVPEQNSIGNWFEAIGQIILTINAQANVIDKDFSSKSTPSIQTLVKEIDEIKEFLKQHYQ